MRKNLTFALWLGLWYTTACTTFSTGTMGLKSKKTEPEFFKDGVIPFSDCSMRYFKLQDKDGNLLRDARLVDNHEENKRDNLEIRIFEGGSVVEQINVELYKGRIAGGNYFNLSSREVGVGAKNVWKRLKDVGISVRADYTVVLMK